MKKVVFFTEEEKTQDALEYFDLNSFSNKMIPVKLHMGELKNKFFPRPDFVGMIISVLKKYDVNPFLFDTTVAYKALRSTHQGYEKVAKLHGFTRSKIGCDVVIDDKGVLVTVDGRDYEVAEHIIDSSCMLAISHVKGHIATGFGGAIKNFGMGGVTKDTKLRMHHGSRPRYNKDECTYCGICAEVCPFNAIDVKVDRWNMSIRKCFGCGVCVENCPGGLSYEDADLQYVLACAAKACVEKKNVIYVNDVNRIARSCDCDPFAGPIICPDIGYLVSDDPVAVDKASLDLISDVKKDVFVKENKVDPYKQIKYGEEIGLGISSYKLIEI